MQYRSLGKTDLHLLASIIFASISLALNYGNWPNSSVVSVAIAYSFLRASSPQDLDNWPGSPFRFAMPAFVILQLAYWLRCVCQIYQLLPEGYPYTWWGYESSIVPQACADYLLLHYLYFLALSFGYGRARLIASTDTHDIVQRRAILWGGSLLVVAEVGFLLTYRQEGTPAIIGYTLSNLSRFRDLFWILLAFLALRPKARDIKLSVIAIHALSFLGGWLVLLTTKMRFLVFEQVACVAIAVVTSRRRLRPREYALAAGVGAAGMFLFVSATAIKTSESQTDPSLHTALGAVEQFIGRGASFHADAAVLRSPSLQTFLVDNRTRILLDSTTFPFSGILWEQLINVSRQGNIDMTFNWTATNRFDESSTFLSGLTCLRFGVGLSAACCFAVVFGLLHGRAARWLVAKRVAGAWVMSQALFLPIAINGLRRLDFGGLLLNAFLFAFTISLLSRKVRQRARARITGSAFRICSQSSFLVE